MHHSVTQSHSRSIQATVTRLFQLRKLPDPELATELPILNDKLSQLCHSEVGPFLGEFYQNQILKKCMIILRQELVEERGEALIRKLASLWTQFYTSILPTLQAIFAPVQVCSILGTTLNDNNKTSFNVHTVAKAVCEGPDLDQLQGHSFIEDRHCWYVSCINKQGGSPNCSSCADVCTIEM